MVKRALKEGHHTVVLSRKPYFFRSITDKNLQAEFWDGKTIGNWVDHLRDADAVVNLAGESIAEKPWKLERKFLIKSSRIDATRILVHAITRCMTRPKVLVNGSAVGFYGSVPEGEVTEAHSKGKGFLSDVCDDWEAEANKAKELGVRVVLLRTGVVMEKSGGALKKFVTPFRFFMGGPLGSGRQWFPWVHREDVVGAIFYAIQNEVLSGPINAVAPESVTMTQFCRALGKAMKRPSRLPVPAFALRMILGEMSDMLLTGQRAVPQRLQQAGYIFRYPRLEQALQGIFWSV